MATNLHANSSKKALISRECAKSGPQINGNFGLGTDGLIGIGDKKSLIKLTDEPMGANCFDNPGKKVEGGIDVNGDGVLDATEITTVQYVCEIAGLTAASTGCTVASASTARQRGAFQPLLVVADAFAMALRRRNQRRNARAAQGANRRP